MPLITDDYLAQHADTLEIQVAIPNDFKRSLEDGVYLFVFHKGANAGNFHWSANDVGRVFTLSDNQLIKVLKVTPSFDRRDYYVKIQVLNGLVWVPAIIAFLLVTSFFVLSHWVITDIVKLTEAATETETVTETYVDSEGVTHTRITETKKPPNLNPFDLFKGLIPVIIVGGLAYVLFVTPFGKKILA
jgi:hypothetical protein